MFSFFKRRLSVQITLLFLALVLACALSIGISSYVFYHEDSIASNANRALAVAQSTAALVDGGEFESIMESGEKTEYWLAVKSIVDGIKKRTQVKYLYILGAEYDDEMLYFAEGYDAETDSEEEIDLWDSELIEIDGEATYADEMFETINNGTPTVSSVYESGDWGMMVSGFAAITNSAGQVVGVVGVDISLAEVSQASNEFGLRIIAIIALYCVLAGIFSVLFARRRIGRPLATLTVAANKMAVGNMEVGVETTRQDEIGVLGAAFAEMAQATRDQADVLAQLAEGDLMVRVSPRGENDLMSQAMMKTVGNLEEMVAEVQSSSQQVALGAGQIATGAQTLAARSTQQVSTLQQFSAAINDVLLQSQENMQAAEAAYSSVRDTGALMEDSMRSMQGLTRSMQMINESSEKIAGVIQVVDDIAAQTNILALNAAVEAARAGEHGKGFAVVADEVRNLAAKSAQAAKETGDMISENIDKVKEGAGIATNTYGALQKVNTISGENAQAMERIKNASARQNEAISGITEDIGELSGVVQANSATAEQSAAAAQEMSSQSQVLSSIIGRFKVNRGQGQLPPNT